MGDINNSRRDFVKKAALLSSTAGLLNVLPMSIQQALAIDAAPGSTFMDAEHVVFLMQENRSFDHCFGTLKGVRGFNDPRAIRLADQQPVWLQSDAQGHRYAPFRLNLKDTRSTWMSSLPHSWENQVDALNGGKNDNWLESKKSGNKDFAAMPLTMGYYNREDIPFYYALADAFTVCDQHFCSALTGTSPNRLFFWTGTIRAEQNEQSKAHVWNGEIDHKDIHWPTFPERLEEHGISWKVYQNELSIPVGFEGEEEDWLANFTDNDLEFFSQYHVRLHPKHLEFMAVQIAKLQQEIKKLEDELKNAVPDAAAGLKKKQEQLAKLRKDQLLWNKEKFEQLSEREKNIHKKAFVTNVGDPDYHELVKMSYDDAGQTRELSVPKGDVLHQFRKDVTEGVLPAVSWLVPPSHFSDHPGSPWYGAWYISEVMDILTKNPEQWKKTIFIITYDENDGYFDHVPPFLPPHTAKPETGKASAGIDTRAEHVSMAQEVARGIDEKYRRESPIGLGFRVPMLVVSPWTKGGWVNSEVFDHTSCLQFLEKFLSAKTGKEIKQPQISEWRRTVCGDLSSIFREVDLQSADAPLAVEKDAFIQGINNARFKPLPSGFGTQLPQQEKGVKPANALPYQLYVSGKYSAGDKHLGLTFESRSTLFGARTAGAPFTVYLPGKTNMDGKGWDSCKSLSYAVRAGDKLNDALKISNFENEKYQVEVNGPNGFFRGFKGSPADPDLRFICEYQRDPLHKDKLTGNLEFIMVNDNKNSSYEIRITDHAYGAAVKNSRLIHLKSVIIDLTKSYGWYDFSVTIAGYPDFEQKFAGRVENGKHGYSDPQMGA